MRLSFFVALMLLTTTTTTLAQGLGDPDPLVIGDSFLLESKILGETRHINVYAPAGYAESDDLRLPVLYMPDGGIQEDFLHVAGLIQISSLNWTMRPFILVGIENTERRRDLTGPTTVEKDREIAPVVGGSADFRAFLKDELMPAVSGTYRTTGETAIIGESLAGLFVVETLLLEPEMFDTYIALDPSLWWNDQRLVKERVAMLGEHPELKATVFLAASNQEVIAEITARFAADLKNKAPEGLTVHHHPFPEEYHHTIYHPAALLAVRTVFPRPQSQD
jgi:predicted alpha/beta superfamily hydrolase